MLLEPGPIALIPASAFPIPGARQVIEAEAAAIVRAMGDAGAALAAKESEIVTGGATGVDPALALLIGGAAAEHARQAGDVDPALGGVAASTVTLEGDLAGLSGELAEDLKTPEPPYPEIPPALPDQTPGPQEPPPGPDNPPQPDPDWPSLPPVGKCGAGGHGDDWVTLYRGYMAADVPKILGRAATDAELALVNQFHFRYNYIDDCGYNWLLEHFIVPQSKGLQS